MKIELSNTDINQIMKALLIAKGEDHNFYDIYLKFRKKFEDNGIKFEPSKWNGDIKVKEDNEIDYIIYNSSNNSFLEDFLLLLATNKSVIIIRISTFGTTIFLRLLVFQVIIKLIYFLNLLQEDAKLI